MKLLKQTAGAEKHGPIPADFCTAQLKRTLRPQWAPALSFITRFCLRMAYSQILCLRNMFLQKKCYKNGYTDLYSSIIWANSPPFLGLAWPQKSATATSHDKPFRSLSAAAPSSFCLSSGWVRWRWRRITSGMFQETWSEHEKMMNGLIMESWNYHSWKHVPGEYEGFENGLSTEFETRPIPVCPLPSTSSCSPARVPDSWSALHSSCVSAPGTEANDPQGSQIWGLSAMFMLIID